MDHEAMAAQCILASVHDLLQHFRICRIRKRKKLYC